MGYVYLAHAKGTDRYKIGQTSKSPSSRLRSLQTGSPHELELVYSCELESPRMEEKFLHKYFDENHMRGEWFEFSVDKVNEVVDGIKELKRNEFFCRLSELVEEEMGDEFDDHEKALCLVLPFVVSKGLGRYPNDKDNFDPCDFILDLLANDYLKEHQVRMVYDQIGNQKASDNFQ